MGHQNPGIHALKIPALHAMVKTHKSDYSPLQRHRHARIIEHNSRDMMAERNMERKEGDIRALSCLPPCMPLCVCVFPLLCMPLTPSLPSRLPFLALCSLPKLSPRCAVPCQRCVVAGLALRSVDAVRVGTALHCTAHSNVSLPYFFSPNRTESSLVSLPTEVI